MWAQQPATNNQHTREQYAYAVTHSTLPILPAARIRPNRPILPAIGNDHADHLAVAGAKQKGTVAPKLLVVAPGAPAGSELHEDAPTQAYDLFSQFAL